MHTGTEHNAHGAGPGHEKSDANVRSLAAFAVGLVVLMLVGMFAMRLLYVQMAGHQVQNDPVLSPLAAELPKDPPDPRLQVTPVVELQDAREEWRQKDGYGWVEPNAGVVRIPVERAMDLLVERGLPARESGGLEARKSRSEDVRK